MCFQPWPTPQTGYPNPSQGVENLFDRQDRMASYGPTFCDITWGAGGTTADLTLDIAAKMQNMVRPCFCREAFSLVACSIHGTAHGHQVPGSQCHTCMLRNCGLCSYEATPMHLRRKRIVPAGVRRDHDAPDMHQHATERAGERSRQGGLLSCQASCVDHHQDTSTPPSVTIAGKHAVTQLCQEQASLCDQVPGQL